MKNCIADTPKGPKPPNGRAHNKKPKGHKKSTAEAMLLRDGGYAA